MKKMTLKELRERQALTQDEVVKAVGLKSRSNYSNIETGKQKPRPKTRRILAEFFRVKVWEVEF